MAAPIKASGPYTETENPPKPSCLTSIMIMLCRVVLAFLVAPGVESSFKSDIISDITESSADEGRALELKTEQFWQPVLEVAVGIDGGRHEAIYEEAAAVISRLPSQSAIVRDALVEAVASLRKADAAVSAQAAQTSDLASEQMVMSPRSAESVFSFLTGGQSFLSSAVDHFVGSTYEKKLNKDVGQRQVDVLLALQNSAGNLGSVLENCRIASKRSFDVMKYDLYTKGAPKTPAEAKALANRLVDASAATRKSYMALVLEPVRALARDVEGLHEHPSATVTRSLIAAEMGD